MDPVTEQCPDLVDRSSYVVYGSSRWSDPWLTEQNLALALSRRHNVLYIEPPQSPLSPIRYGLRGDTADQIVTLVRGGARAAGPIQLLSPVVFPPRSKPAARALSAPILARQVRQAVRRLGMDAPIAVTAQWTPGIAGAAGESRLVCLVKDWVEAGGHFLGRDPSRLAHDRDALLAASDLVCATSTNLQLALQTRGIDAALLRHGFHTELVSAYNRARPPAAYNRLPRPLLGYTGRVDDRLDFEVLEALAQRFSGGSILLVGPVSPRLPAGQLDRLRPLRNVHLLATRSRSALPAYLVHLDCCLMPYESSTWARYGSPLKLWDYLYAGPPVVGSGYQALREYPPPLVRFAENAEEFVQAVERVLCDDLPSHVAQRREFALSNSWDRRATQLHDSVLASDRRGCPDRLHPVEGRRTAGRGPRRHGRRSTI